MQTRLIPAFAFVLVAAAFAAPAASRDAAARGKTRYFEVVNAAHDSVTAIAIAPAGNDAFAALDIGGPLRGGVTPLILDVPEGGCQRDLRVTFRDGRTLLYPALDLCRYRALRLTPRDAARGARAD